MQRGLAWHGDSVIGAYFSKDQESVWPQCCEHCARVYLLMHLWSLLVGYVPSARMAHRLSGNDPNFTKGMMMMMMMMLLLRK